MMAFYCQQSVVLQRLDAVDAKVVLFLLAVFECTVTLCRVLYDCFRLIYLLFNHSLDPATRTRSMLPEEGAGPPRAEAYA